MGVEMSEQLPNGLTGKYVKGEQNWHDSMNANLDKLDEALAFKGALFIQNGGQIVSAGRQINVGTLETAYNTCDVSYDGNGVFTLPKLGFWRITMYLTRGTKDGLSLIVGNVSWIGKHVLIISDHLTGKGTASVSAVMEIKNIVDANPVFQLYAAGTYGADVQITDTVCVAFEYLGELSGVVAA